MFVSNNTMSRFELNDCRLHDVTDNYKTAFPLDYILIQKCKVGTNTIGTVINNINSALPTLEKELVPDYVQLTPITTFTGANYSTQLSRNIIASKNILNKLLDEKQATIKLLLALVGSDFCMSDNMKTKMNDGTLMKRIVDNASKIFTPHLAHYFNVTYNMGGAGGRRKPVRKTKK